MRIPRTSFGSETIVNLKLHNQNSFFLRTCSKLLPLESKECPLAAVSELAFVDAVNELRFWSTSESRTVQPPRVSSKKLYLALRKIPSLVCCRGNLDFSLKSLIWIKYAGTVRFCKHSKTIPFLVIIWHSPFNPIASQIYKRRVPEQDADHPTLSTVSVRQNFFKSRKSISLRSILMLFWMNLFCRTR